MKVDSVLKFNYCNNYRRPINKTNNISINNKSFMIPVSFRSSYTQEYEPAQIKDGKIVNTNNKILLSSTDDLKALSNSQTYWNDKKYMLSDDIDLSEIDNWVPIGNRQNPFTGEFDGRGHMISNLKINNTENNQGLFGYVEKAVISNLKIDNADIKSKDQSGILIGTAHKSLIKGCNITGKIKGNQRIGGIIGIANTCELNDNTSKGVVFGNEDVGGMIGFDKNSSINKNNLKSSVDGENNIGGFLGYGVNSKIENSYFIGTVSGNKKTGYFAGYDNPVYIKDSFIIDIGNYYKQSPAEFAGVKFAPSWKNVYKNEQVLLKENFKDFDNTIWEIKNGRIPRLKNDVEANSEAALLDEDQNIYINVFRTLTDELIDNENFDTKYTSKYNNRTPIFYCKNSDQTKKLISMDADIFHKDATGKTPLHEYCRQGRTDIIKLLLEYGAGLNVKDKDGVTPLDEAKKAGCLLDDIQVGDKGFSKIIGMTDLKNQLLNEVVKPLTDPEYKKRNIQPLNGVILHGLPRCGKTYIAEALAEELGKSCRNINITDNGSEYQHVTAKAIKSEFSYTDSDSIIFLDELEGIAPQRGKLGGRDSDVDINEQVNVLLAELIKCRNKGIFVIAATNNPERIDSAVKARFEKIFFVPPPDLSARVSLFRNVFEKLQIEDNLNYRDFALKTENYTAEKIKTVANTANIIALNRKHNFINNEDVLDAIKQVKPSITAQQIAKYKNEIPVSENTNIDVQKVRLDEMKGFSKIAGMNDLKEMLTKDVILPLKDPKLYRECVGEPPSGFLMYGPPGCGKTFISKALAEEANRTFIEMDSSVLSPFQNQTTLNIKNIFETARFNAPSILFIDEVEAFVPKRGKSFNNEDDKNTSEFLKQLNDCAQDDVFVILATNHPEMIDSAVKRTGRIDTKIFVPPLDKTARAELMKLHLSKNKRAAKDIDYEKLAEMTEYFSAAQIIKKVIGEAGKEVYFEILNGSKDSKITYDRLEKQIKNIKPEYSEELVKAYKNMIDL